MSLQQGVYGQIVEVQDVRTDDDCPTGRRPWAQNPMTLYYRDSDVSVADDISDDDGIYELPAAAGDYRVCRSTSTCLAVTVPMDGRVRVDLALPFGMFELRDPACPR